MKKIISSLIIYLLIIVCTFTSMAETLNEVKNIKNNVDKKMNELAEKKKQQRETLQAAEQEKKKLLEIQGKYSNIKEKLLGDKKSEELELKTAEDELKTVENNYKASLEAFETRARAMYVNSNKTYLDVIINSKDLLELSSKVYILNSIAKKNREIVQNLLTNKKDLDYKKSLKEMEVAKISMKIDQTNSALSTIKSNQSSINNKISDYSEKLKKIEMEEDALEEESRNLSNKIKLFANTGRKYIGGKMLWPTPSSVNITSPFGKRMHPVLGYARMHAGIDIGAGYGASILASNNGTVRLAGWQGGYGNTVIIDHGGGITSLYGHCSYLLVKEGQKVKIGEIIAKVGSTGISTGPHAHFEIRVNGDPVDPLNYLGK
jgi:murein DD-endopeptidase MepM/ murein hydrolase activator NlpD